MQVESAYKALEAALKVNTSLPPDADYLNLIKASTKIVRPFMSQNRALLQYCHEVVKLYNAVAANKREDKEAGIGEVLVTARDAMTAATDASPNNWDVDSTKKGKAEKAYTKAKDKLKESLTAHGKADMADALDTQWNEASKTDDARMMLLSGRCKVPKVPKTAEEVEIDITVTHSGTPKVVKVHPSTTVGALIWRHNKDNPTNTFTEAKVKDEAVSHEKKVSDLEKDGKIALELV